MSLAFSFSDVRSIVWRHDSDVTKSISAPPPPMATFVPGPEPPDSVAPASLAAAEARHSVVGRLRSFFGIFARASQAGGVRLAHFGLLLFGFLVSVVNRHFSLRADELLTIHLHGLDADYLIANDAHKIYILRRFAIYPFFVFGFAVLLPDFFRRPALGMDHHFLVHPHENMMLEDRILHLGRDRVEISLLFISSVKVENRIQQAPHLLRSQFRHVTIKA